MTLRVDLQDSFPSTDVDMIFVFGIRETGLIHQICADVVLPEVRRNLKALLKIPRMIRDNVNITTTWAPESE